MVQPGAAGVRVPSRSCRLSCGPQLGKFGVCSSWTSRVMRGPLLSWLHRQRLSLLPLAGSQASPATGNLAGRFFLLAAFPGIAHGHARFPLQPGSCFFLSWPFIASLAIFSPTPLIASFLQPSPLFQLAAHGCSFHGSFRGGSQVTGAVTGDYPQADRFT